MTRAPLLLVILGPTASGKTALSLELARHFAGEVVSCDSVAVYRELEVGTAKPSSKERAQAPHHLLDVVSPAETFTAGDYSRLAREAIAGIRLRGKIPIVVGGTGLYLRALLEGLFPGPTRSEELRVRLRETGIQRGSSYLHRILRRLDPQAAQGIHLNDAPKLVRAIEVCLTTRKKMSELWQWGRDPLTGYRILRIGLDPPREQLYARINERARRMFELGLLQETQELMQKYGRDARPLQSLGYKQALQHLNGELSMAEAIAGAQQGHRNYAKRQMTWFRREPEVHWIAGFGDDAATQKQTAALISQDI